MSSAALERRAVRVLRIRPDLVAVDLATPAFALVAVPFDMLLEPLEVALGLVQPTEPQVLRIFRGAVREGELNAYVDEARAGTIADIEAGHGPHALYLGVDPPTEFVTVSLWDDWDAIESATGGDIRRPVATRHADRLTRGTAQHYEVVTDISAAIPE